MHLPRIQTPTPENPEPQHWWQSLFPNTHRAKRARKAQLRVGPIEQYMNTRMANMARKMTLAQDQKNWKKAEIIAARAHAFETNITRQIHSLMAA